MSIAMALLALVLHGTLMLAAAPTLAGLLDAGRARLAGRAGPPVLQPWRDLARLLRKRPVVADQASFVTAGGAYACFAANAAAALLVPSFALGMLSAPAADLFVLLGLLALARIALALAALDAGTAFGGIGASRTGLFAVFAEPALALVVLWVALIAGGTNLDHAAAVLRDGQGLAASLVLAAVAAAMAALVETGRLFAHGLGGQSEPSMVREAALLELSGRHLALAEGAGQLRVLVWFGLLAALFLPFGLAPEGAGPVAWLLGLLAWAVKVALLAGLLLLAEVAGARMRVLGVPQFLGIAILLALLAAVFLFAGQRAA